MIRSEEEDGQERDRLSASLLATVMLGREQVTEEEHKDTTWTDLTGLVSGLSSGPLGRREDGELAAPSGRPFGMLRQSSFTVTGTFDSAAYFPMEPMPPRTRVSYQMPASWWQALKQRLKQWPGLGWLPVRMRTWAFEGVMEQPTMDEESGEIGFSLTGVNGTRRG